MSTRCRDGAYGNYMHRSRQGRSGSSCDSAGDEVEGGQANEALRLAKGVRAKSRWFGRKGKGKRRNTEELEQR